MAEKKKMVRTFRGLPDDEEPDKEYFFAHSACLRIFGDIPSFQEITENLMIAPSHIHRRGEPSLAGDSNPWPHDMWSYTPDIPPEKPLEEHINRLWLEIEPHKQYLVDLKKSLTVDVFLGYRSNCDTAGVDVPHNSLRMFIELEVPFSLSIVIC